jgi:trehalose 6-phosphate phosphatase
VEAAPELLAGLASKFTVAAVVSGRSAVQLLEWLGEVEIWGLHGAERTEGGEVVLSGRARPYEAKMRRVRDEAQQSVAALDFGGVTLEDKGVILNLHYRTATDRAAAEKALLDLAEQLAAAHGLVVGRGRMTYELRPPEKFSKADVVLERSRAEKLDAVMFVGDDLVDLPAFGALDELAAAGTLTLKVGVRSDESPEELLERADLVVDGPFGVVQLLEELLAVAG